MSYCVVIPSYQRPKMLERALISVYKQTILPEVIYLIIDEPEDWVKYAFLKEFDKRLKVTYTGGGFGGARSRNVGLSLVQNDYVFFLDDDDEWLPRKAELQMQLLDRNPNAVGVTCGRRVVTSGSRCSQEFIPKAAHLRARIRVENLTGSFSFFGFSRSRSTVDMRLDEYLQSAQDLEFYIQLSTYGEILVVPDVLAVYYKHNNPRITDDSISKLQARIHILNKHKNLYNRKEIMEFKAKIYKSKTVVERSSLRAIYYAISAISYSIRSGCSIREAFKGLGLKTALILKFQRRNIIA